ncbi:hypothetical protein [Bacillus sp. FJAT-28004]|uniref:hypothetical protein n=1 Tax=Bacillus sp. FJAT-28004 TaxID=1679165 RepID=UPI0006B47815|nr:hypothetical protein [Bacillus sp. FJAT-28004]
MTRTKYMYLISALIVLLLASACGNQSNNELDATATPITKPENEATGDQAADTDSDKKILIIIDQTEKPIEGNSFDFVVKQLPEGFALAEMQWVSKENQIINSVQLAIEHGASGGDGFYISGDGQFTGFFYPDAMKGEKGQVVFVFKNEQGKELTWKKEITLK